MKFGRLAKFYETNKKLFPPLELTGLGEDALRVIIAWDRDFGEINGLQNIEHQQAIDYLEKYEHDRGLKNNCVMIVNFIKEENSKCLGKLAWEFEKRFPVL
ncbi:Hypothetical predicted protein, partial [Paramuricea clavata]